MISRSSGISFRLFSVAALSTLGIVAVAVIGLWALHSSLYENKTGELRRLVELATSEATAARDRAEKGEMTQDAAKAFAAQRIGELRYDGDNYVFIQDTAGTIVQHPSAKLRGTSGLDLKDPDGKYLFREMNAVAARDGRGMVPYRWAKPGAQEATPKLTYVVAFPQWGWVIGSGMWVDDIEAQFRSSAMLTGALSIGFVLVVGIIGVLMVRSVTRPLGEVRTAMLDLGNGNVDVKIDTDRRDEIGEMARAVAMFRQQEVERRALQHSTEASEAAKAARERRIDTLVSDFRGHVGQLLSSVGSDMRHMNDTAHSLTATADSTSQQAASAARASQDASLNVDTVSTAGEELMESINEIGRQVSRTTEIVSHAAQVSQATNHTVGELEQAAGKIGAVVGLIRDIAEQTNLLALNATIEAARAGESGRGFAVVAAEVKNLAGQTAKATEEISSQIAAIQGTTGEAVKAIGEIARTMEAVNTSTSAIAAAVEEQGASTAEIARNVSEAAQGTRVVADNISGVTRAVAETSQAAGMVAEVTGRVASTSEDLKKVVDRFLSDVAAA